MFWNHVTCFYYFNQCYETMRRVSITLALLWNNATCFYHFSDLLKQCLRFHHFGDLLKHFDVVLSLWRWFETMLCVYHYSECWNKCDVLTITLAMVWNNAIGFYPFSNGLKQLRGLSDEFYHFLINSTFLKTTSSVIFF